MQYPNEFDLKNYYFRKVTHYYTVNDYRDRSYSDFYYYDINGNRTTKFWGDGVARIEDQHPENNDLGLNMINTDKVYDNHLSATHNIEMNYANYLSLLCEVANHKKQINELQEEIESLKGTIEQCIKM